MPRARSATALGALTREELLEAAKGPDLRLALQLERIGDGGAALRRVERETAALEAGDVVTVDAFQLSAALHAAGTPLHEVRVVYDAGGLWTIDAGGSYRRA